MYCWNDNISLEDELLNYKDVKSFKAATAFLSKDGVRIIEAVAKKYNLSKKKYRFIYRKSFRHKNRINY